MDNYFAEKIDMAWQAYAIYSIALSIYKTKLLTADHNTLNLTQKEYAKAAKRFATTQETNKGILNGSPNGLTQAERKMVDDLLNAGKNVEIIPRSNVSKRPDFLVDGVKTELKTLNGNSLNTPVTRIQDGFKQGAETVLIDARGTNITKEQTNVIIHRALGVYNGKLPGNVEIWTKSGIYRW